MTRIASTATPTPAHAASQVTKSRLPHYDSLVGRPPLLHSLRLIAVAAFAAVVCGCWQGTTREVSSMILFVDGQPTLSPASRENSIPLATDLHPGPGDILETPGTSRAGLSLLPNLLVQLDRGARMEIIRLALTKDGNETGNDMRGRFAKIKMAKGRLLVSQAWGEALARFGVTTPHGEVTTPSNALFIVESDPQKTRVLCASGYVEFQPSGALTGTRIPPGSVGQWPSAAPNLTKAEADPIAQDDFLQAVEVEQILRKLTAQKRNALPP